MPVYSHSRLSAFEQCPLKFKFAYIDKLETEIEETIESFLGSRVHEALEKLYKDLRFQKLLTSKELLDFFNSEWKKNWNKSILIVRKEYDQENYRKMGEKFLMDYYNRYKPFNQSRTIALETNRTIDIDNEKKYHIHIMIDRLCIDEKGVYEIHDYKTSNSLPTQQELDNDRQLAIYAYGIKKMYPDAEKIRLIWHFLAFDNEMQSLRTDKQLEALRKDVLELIKQIESCKDFPAQESGLCEWCEFRPECPNFKHLFELESKSVNEYLSDNGVQLVNKYAQLVEDIKRSEERLELIREALILYTQRKGIEVVYGSDIKASIKSYPRMKFPDKHEREEFNQLIRELGLWDQLAIVDTYELAKMINNKELHEDFIRLLDKFIKKEVNNRVNLRKK